MITYLGKMSIASNATGGNRNVTVSGSGQTSNAVNFYVQIPTSLSVLSVTVLPHGTGGCIVDDYGIKVAIKYQVNDQSSINTPTPIQNNIMVPQETITNFVVDGIRQPDPFPNFGDIGPSDEVPFTSRTTSAMGQFFDAPYGNCQTSPFIGTFTQNIRILIDGTQNSYQVRTNNVTVSSNAPGAGVVTNGSDIQKSRP